MSAAGQKQSVGLSPGTLIHIGKRKTEKVRITLIEYGATDFHEREVESIDDSISVKKDKLITWINIDGIHNIDTIERIGGRFDVHPLTLEDILNTESRPKMDDYETYLFFILKMFEYSDEKGLLNIEQVSIILKENLVVSFQEAEGDVFEPVRDRIRSNKGKIRKQGSDYLAYALMDAVVDHYFVIMEKLGEDIEWLQEELIESPTDETLQEIHKLKREMIYLRKSAWPLREIISKMQRRDSPLIRETTLIYLSDVYDHTVQVIDSIETFREMLSGMIDVYLSSVSNRMNEVMKVLTIIATIFIPLTFIVGVYGMNFVYMPELEWHWGYFTVWGVMIAIAVGMLIYFRRKKWI